MKTCRHCGFNTNVQSVFDIHLNNCEPHLNEIRSNEVDAQDVREKEILDEITDYTGVELNLEKLCNYLYELERVK